MASEVLSFTPDPINGSGTAAVSTTPTLLPHSSRTLSANLSGQINADKFGGRITRDSVTVSYTTDGGANWIVWFTQTASFGLEDVSQALLSIAIDATAPIASILVKLNTTDFWPDTSCALNTIKLTCDDTPIPANASYCECEFPL